MMDNEVGTTGPLRRLWRAYRLRWKRRYFLARAIRRRKQLSLLSDKTDQIADGAILLFCTVRNEADRLPHFLAHYRALGVSHFLFVANDCTDDTEVVLAKEPDVSVWTTPHSYKASRFGIDWLTYLQWRFAGGHWTVTVDADELLVYPGHETRSLPELGDWLEARGYTAISALMLDLFPKGRLDAQTYSPGQNPTELLGWFDADNFNAVPRPDFPSDIVRGGIRLRKFFAEDPLRAPTMNKIPFVKWSRRYAYMTSTHVILPTALNALDDPDLPTAALLHTKFLPQVVLRSIEEKSRHEHFTNSVYYDAYYDQLADGEPLWHEGATQFDDVEQLITLGLVRGGKWHASPSTKN